jgi:exopolysaccharide biosynthesis polyprenyl glycosylphosphotransferase
MLRRFSINYAFLSMLIDMLVVGLCLWVAKLVRPEMSHWSIFEPMALPVYLPSSLYVIFPIVSVAILAAFAIYDSRKLLRIVDEFAALSIALLIVSISLAGILYFSFRDVSRALFAVFLVMSYGGLLGWRGLARLYFRLRRDWPDTSRRLLVVGAGPLGQKVRDQILASQIDKLQLLGFIDDGVNLEGPLPNLLGGFQQIHDLVNTLNITDVVIALPHSAYDHMADIVSRLEDAPVRLWVALGFFDLTLYETRLEDFAGIPMLDLRAPALNEVQRLLKRAFDLALGTIAFIISAPIMLIAAFAILLEDGRPILFIQKRVGENGRLFMVYKFRTMVKNAEELRHLVERKDEDGNIVHKRKDDPRITRVGRFLRRTSIDEIPQFFNVLQGTMSLVGPRPELPYLVEKYQPWQRKRFSVQPGITGWWQVNGRGESTMHLHTEDDLYYITHYSIWLDILILIRTAWVVLIGKGSY